MFGFKNIRIVIVFVTIALLALVAIQVYWITNAIKINEEEFNKNVKASLYNSAKFVHNYHSKIATPSTKRIKLHHKANTVNVRDTLIDYDTVILKVKMIEKIEWNKEKTGMTKTQLIIHDSTGFDSIYQSILKEVYPAESFQQAEWTSDTTIVLGDIKNDEHTDGYLERYLFLLDSLFKIELISLGIDQEYYLMAGHDRKSPIYFNSENAKDGMENWTQSDDMITAEVLEADYQNSSLMAYVFFPSKRKALVGELWWLMVISAIVILILILSFYYSIKTIFVQKKLSVVKNDFINNMTHELKTPISTIGLACEMLNDESITTSEAKRKNYVSMIRDENRRLGTLVESVLQSAVIEKGELTLKPEKLELNDLIQEVAINFEIQISKREGTLQLKLNAAHDFVWGDKVHLSNVIFNLLDNANKYSFDAPNITISTGNANEKIIISVTDTGIGIGKEDQKKIFEKLYRIPTGNVHNVKGFGLGLSYVKAVIEKHSGEVDVDSEPGKGSTFTLSLPLYHGKES